MPIAKAIKITNGGSENKYPRYNPIRKAPKVNANFEVKSTKSFP